MTNIGCRFIVFDFLAINLSVADFAAPEISLLTISNGLTENPLLVL